MTKGKNVTVALIGASVSADIGTINAQAFRPLPDDHPCYRLVGLVAAETARVEKLIDQSICNVADIDSKVGACLTGQMIGPTPRFNALQQLARNRGISDALLKRIKTTGGHSNKHFDRRNRAVHDPWLEDAQTGAAYQDRGKPKSDPSFGPTPVSEQELKNTLEEMRKYRSEVSDLVADIWVELNSSSP